MEVGDQLEEVAVMLARDHGDQEEGGERGREKWADLRCIGGCKGQEVISTMAPGCVA